ncbi:MAG: hypothetical protein IPP07_29365 [Holophagales bacterium]|nr:hypothetical protein [Holophagales bacterium]
MIFFSLDGTLPDQSVATTQITMFAMKTGNAHLMMDGDPKMLGACRPFPTAMTPWPRPIAGWASGSTGSG